MSVGQLMYNSEKKQFELELRVFADDFLAAQQLNIPEHMISPAMVQQYILDNLSFWFNGTEQKLKFVRMETEGPSIVTFWRLKSKGVDYHGLENIRCENLILLANFRKQQNIIRFEFDGVSRTMRFRQKQAIQELSL